ncbi:MAG: hypothetical protein L3K16_04940 [Thermoplasmata archaeon]|nr:hypothetical protein [Thermoplasmata archaeon]
MRQALLLGLIAVLLVSGLPMGGSGVAPLLGGHAILSTVGQNHTGPGGRAAPIFVYDPPARGAILFGGTTWSNGVVGCPTTTWEFSSGRWANLNVTGPRCRNEAVATYDPALGGVLMYGGSGCRPAGPLTGCNDTWLFANGTWTNLTPRISGIRSPPVNYGMSMAYDTRDGYALLFGGTITSTPISNETWAFRNNTWFQPKCGAARCATPHARAGASMAFDPAIGHVVMYGGEGGYDSMVLNDTWWYANGSWFNKTVPSGPVAPHGHGAPGGLAYAAMTWDPACQCVVVFGGLNGIFTMTNRTWEYKSGVWVGVHVAANPRHLWTPAVVYMPGPRAVVLWGGQPLLKSTVSRPWAFNGTTWYRV